MIQDNYDPRIFKAFAATNTPPEDLLLKNQQPIMIQLGATVIEYPPCDNIPKQCKQKDCNTPIVFKNFQDVERIENQGDIFTWRRVVKKSWVCAFTL